MPITGPITSLIEALVGPTKRGQIQRTEAILEGQKLFENLGEQTNLLPGPEKAAILEYLKNKYGFEPPQDSGMIDVGGAIVNRPGGPAPIPFPSTKADYERSLEGQMSTLYTPSELTKMDETISQTAKRKYEMDQTQLSGKFAEEFGKLGMVKGLMNIGPEDISSLTSKYSSLDPLTIERVLGNYGIDPKGTLKEQKKNFAFKNISDFQLQKKGDLTKDLNFWTTQVFPYVDAGDAFAMIRHFTPSAGTKDKQTLNDIEASLVDRFLKGEDFNDRELVVLSNIALRFNPLVKVVMDNYMDTRLMRKDPVAKAQALKELNQALRDAMSGWLLGSDLVPEPTPAPKPKVQSNQVPKGGAPREKPAATHKYNPATGRIEEVR